MAPHSSTLACKIPWTEEPGRLQSVGSLRVGHDWATSLSLFTLMHWRRKPLQCSCLENPRDGGARWAAVYGVAQSRARLKRLSSSSRLCCQAVSSCENEFSLPFHFWELVESKACVWMPLTLLPIPWASPPQCSSSSVFGACQKLYNRLWEEGKS